MENEHISTNQKIILILAIGFMSLALFLPIWKIEIWAPQYPEGLIMKISANHIGGNVDQINILNHYIGMKKIIPDQIPELSIIPWLLKAIIGLGFLSLFLNHIKWVRIWLAMTLTLLFCGLIDFYRWGYNYGHDLNQDAPIIIPGLTYQPPLFGFKKILNIEAYSLPDLGTYALTIGLLLAFTVAFSSVLKKNSIRLRLRYAASILISFTFFSCTQNAVELKNGDECTNCHMKISDTRFGAEVITSKGRILKFDSLPCLHKFLSQNANQAKSIFVSDYFQSSLIKVEDANFLDDSNIVGPMGRGPIASKSKPALEKLKAQASGKVTDWKGLSYL